MNCSKLQPTNYKQTRWPATKQGAYDATHKLYKSHLLQVILRPTVSRPVCLGVGPPSGTHDQIFITVRHLRSSCWGAPFLTRGRVCIYSYNLLSLFGPRPAELMTSYCLIWDRMLLPHMTPPTWRTRFLYLYQPGTGWPRHWVNFFLCLLRLAGLRWRY
jgi:hypothetical protein